MTEKGDRFITQENWQFLQGNLLMSIDKMCGPCKREKYQVAKKESNGQAYLAKGDEKKSGLYRFCDMSIKSMRCYKLHCQNLDVMKEKCLENVHSAFTFTHVRKKVAQRLLNQEIT